MRKQTSYFRCVAFMVAMGQDKWRCQKNRDRIEERSLSGRVDCRIFKYTSKNYRVWMWMRLPRKYKV